MKIKIILLAINLVSMTSLSVCMEPNLPEQSTQPTGCPECQRLKEWLTNFEDAGSFGNIETVVFLSSQNCNNPLVEMTFKEFQEKVLYYAGCLSNKSAPMP